jgi:hypothetical protein
MATAQTLIEIGKAIMYGAVGSGVTYWLTVNRDAANRERERGDRAAQVWLNIRTTASALLTLTREMKSDLEPGGWIRVDQADAFRARIGDFERHHESVTFIDDPARRFQITLFLVQANAAMSELHEMTRPRPGLRELGIVEMTPELQVMYNEGRSRRRQTVVMALDAVLAAGSGLELMVDVYDGGSSLQQRIQDG